MPVADIAEAVLVRSGYVAGLEASSDLQDTDRIENLKELVVAAREFDALRGEAGPPDPETPGWRRARSRTSWSRCPWSSTLTRSRKVKITGAR